ncbi:MAG: hypothetical protein M3352_12705 [Bacteroidota bacterium]|nr:hypothetical protein [Bacteroidota bacterium]
MIKIFDYIDELNCFVVNPKFKEIADYLGITEWNEVVWIGRYFTLDNDYGEHWFDNWQEKDALEEKAIALRYPYDDLLVIDPERFRNGKDGPCHNDEEIKNFWTDVLKSLHLNINTIISEAIKFNQEALNRNGSDYLPDLEERIQHVKNKYLIL